MLTQEELKNRIKNLKLTFAQEVIELTDNWDDYSNTDNFLGQIRGLIGILEGRIAYVESLAKENK